MFGTSYLRVKVLGASGIVGNLVEQRGSPLTAQNMCSDKFGRFPRADELFSAIFDRVVIVRLKASRTWHSTHEHYGASSEQTTLHTGHRSDPGPPIRHGSGDRPGNPREASFLNKKNLLHVFKYKQKNKAGKHVELWSAFDTSRFWSTYIDIDIDIDIEKSDRYICRYFVFRNDGN